MTNDNMNNYPLSPPFVCHLANIKNLLWYRLAVLSNRYDKGNAT